MASNLHDFGMPVMLQFRPARVLCGASAHRSASLGASALIGRLTCLYCMQLDVELPQRKAEDKSPAPVRTSVFDMLHGSHRRVASSPANNGQLMQALQRLAAADRNGVTRARETSCESGRALRSRPSSPARQDRQLEVRSSACSAHVESMASAMHDRLPDMRCCKPDLAVERTDTLCMMRMGHEETMPIQMGLLMRVHASMMEACISSCGLVLTWNACTPGRMGSLRNRGHQPLQAPASHAAHAAQLLLPHHAGLL